MEGNLIIILAYMGAFSLYVVAATLTGRAIYAATRSWGDDGRLAAAVFGGAFFPLTVPIALVVVWAWSFFLIPSRLGNEECTDTIESSQELDEAMERIRTLERNRETPSRASAPKPKTKFKAGDLITGVKGNPAGYKHLYEGCVCRVLEVDGKKAMRVILIDHTDLIAHKDYLGKEFKAPQRYFTLIKPVAKRKAVSAKKVAKRK